MSQQQAPKVVSDQHASMALGAVAAELASRRSQITGDVRCPEPPEWLAMWHKALEATLPAARAAMREVTGAADPTHNEKLEVETIAQAHFDGYNRVKGLPEAVWESLPEEQRAMMMATIADMLASGIIVVGPQAAQPKGSREAWIVCTNRPSGPDDPAMFVETELADGTGIGQDRGLRWEDHPDGGDLVRVGPFQVPAAV